MDIRGLITEALRQGWRMVDRFLRTIPAIWLVVMGIVAVPIAILSAVVALAFFILLVLLAFLSLLFYLMIWRPLFGSRKKRTEKVIEAEYTVRPDDEP